MANYFNKVLVTGATGYVGGRLIPRLLEAGYSVRALVRDPNRLQGRPWSDQIEVVVGDVLNPDSLPAAMAGIEAAYYLIHSMSDGANFHQRDLMAARNFARAAHATGIKRLIYLGGLGDSAADLSQHLRSRQETGTVLCEAGVPVTEFRAAIIVGAGSISFEMIRNLTERLPVMICPRWVFTRTQPISVRNLLDYLVATLETPESAGQVIEIGGPEVMTYAEMMLGYAQVRGLRRWLIAVPVLTPRLSSYWVHWMTPVPAAIARPLIEGLRNEVVVRDDKARHIFGQIQPVDYETAVSQALEQLESGYIETGWSDALVTSQGDLTPVVLTQTQGLIIERRQQIVAAPPAAVFRIFSGLGGKRGWLYANWAWQLRGLLDRLVGGVGLRRGRRNPDEVRVGDALDFWRVEAIEPDHLLRLRAEMKVPGLAWLQFEAESQANDGTGLVQTAFFAPKGLFGQLYWYLLYPIHRLIFSGMIKRVGWRAEAFARGEDPFPPSPSILWQRQTLAGIMLAAVVALLVVITLRFRRRG
jgi:uncharacterized protein YbjT (DUF2867 family)